MKLTRTFCTDPACARHPQQALHPYPGPVPHSSRSRCHAGLAPDQSTWSGRRDHAFLLVAVQTGLRLSEMTGLKRADLILGTGAHLRVIGKGRKERCTPLAQSTLAVLKAWLPGRTATW